MATSLEAATKAATELFAKLDAVRGQSPDGKLPRAKAIETVAQFLMGLKMTKPKKANYSAMTDDEFKEFLLNTYTWLNVDREIQKGAAWTTTNRKKTPSRKGIVNWLNKAEGDRPFDPTRPSGNRGDQKPIPEPEEWIDVIRTTCSENSMWYEYTSKTWDSIPRHIQYGIVQFVEARKKDS